tara:strand:- start:549 stop:1229 length:681 start_codon:yes stop_codon:yes gene_type:complete
MANPTTNYGWPMPTATDLVTDLPADFAAFGQPVDTSLKALNPETTLGDIAYRSATSNTNTRLGIGSTGQVLTVAGGVPSWASPAGGGKVLQVVYGMYNTDTTINNTSYTATGLTASITPTSASSKVLVLTSNFFYVSAASGNITTGGRIMRGATNVYEQHPTQWTFGLIIAASGDRGALNCVNMQYLDSPATTSATTYTTQFKTNANFVFQWDNGKSNIVLMEIGA